MNTRLTGPSAAPGSSSPVHASTKRKTSAKPTDACKGSPVKGQSTLGRGIKDELVDKQGLSSSPDLQQESDDSNALADYFATAPPDIKLLEPFCHPSDGYTTLFSAEGMEVSPEETTTKKESADGSTSVTIKKSAKFSASDAFVNVTKKSL